jgi:hypothetical protein
MAGTIRLDYDSLEDRLAPAAINFSLVPASSSLTLSGSVNGSAISEQKAGSLTTTYSGTVRVDLDFTNQTIEFLPTGSAMNANNNGTWIPAVGGGTGFSPGSALGNYGGNVTISGLLTRVAARSLVGAFNSTPLPLTGTGPSTFPSGQTLQLTSGGVDYNNFLLQGNAPLAGQGGANAASNGTFTDLGNGNYSLTMPSKATINTTTSGFTIVLNVNGTLTATATLPVVDLNGSAAGADATFSHTAGSAASKISPAAIVTRNPAANLSGMTITIAGTPDGVAESLAANLAGTGLSSPGYDSLTGQLVITGTASLATYQTVLQSVTYANSKSNATPGLRSLTVTTSDGTNTSLVRLAAGNVVVPMAAAKVDSVTVNDGSVQRSRVTAVTVAFDSLVTLPVNPATAFGLVRQSDSAPVGLNAAVDNSGPATLVTLTFTSGPLENISLADGRYTLTVLAANVNSGGFDGNNDGTPGDNFTLAGDKANGFYRLYGDLNADGTTDGSDLTTFGNAFGTNSLAFDWNNDATIDGADLTVFGNRFGAVI